MNYTFDQLPGLIAGLQQKIETLQTSVDGLLAAKMQPAPPEERFHGDKELANYLKVTVQTIHRLKMAGKIPFHRVGRKYYFLRSEIDMAFKNRSNAND